MIRFPSNIARDSMPNLSHQLTSYLQILFSSNKPFTSPKSFYILLIAQNGQVSSFWEEHHVRFSLSAGSTRQDLLLVS